MKINIGVLIVGIFQAIGAIMYFCTGAVKMGIVYVCFSITSFIFCSMAN